MKQRQIGDVVCALVSLDREDKVTIDGCPATEWNLLVGPITRIQIGFEGRTYDVAGDMAWHMCVPVAGSDWRGRAECGKATAIRHPRFREPHLWDGIPERQVYDLFPTTADDLLSHLEKRDDAQKALDGCVMVLAGRLGPPDNRNPNQPPEAAQPAATTPTDVLGQAKREAEDDVQGEVAELVDTE